MRRIEKPASSALRAVPSSCSAVCALSARTPKRKGLTLWKHLLRQARCRRSGQASVIGGWAAPLAGAGSGGAQLEFGSRLCGGWRSPAARTVRDREVSGSNPEPPTKLPLLNRPTRNGRGRRLELNADEFTTRDLDPLEHLGIQEPLDVRMGAEVPPVGVRMQLSAVMR